MIELDRYQRPWTQSRRQALVQGAGALIEAERRQRSRIWRAAEPCAQPAVE